MVHRGASAYDGAVGATLHAMRLGGLVLVAGCTPDWTGLADGSGRPPTSATDSDVPQPPTGSTPTTTPTGTPTGGDSGAPATAHTGDTAAAHTGDTAPPAPTWEPVVRADQLPDLSGYPPLVVGAVLDSGFGPRRVSGDGGRWDFHPGVDLDAPLGTPVWAIADGVVHDRDFDGPNTLFIEHPLPAPIVFHGQSVDRFFVMYSHLDTIDVAIGEPVEAGQQVGTVGDTGDAVEPHLHAEVRLGAWCSLRYAVDHPESDCSLGFDPAINPVRLVGGSTPGGLEVTTLAEAPFTVRVRTAEGDFDWNRVESDLGVVDFDLREGFDARSDETIDDFDHGWVVIDPVPDADEPDHQSWILTFPEAPAWVEVVDWRGEGWRLDR